MQAYSAIIHVILHCARFFSQCHEFKVDIKICTHSRLCASHEINMVTYKYYKNSFQQYKYKTNVHT